MNWHLLTQIVPALHHLRDVYFCGSRRNLHDLVVAYFGQAVLKQARDELTCAVVPSAHAAFIRHLSRTQEVVAAGALHRETQETSMTSNKHTHTRDEVSSMCVRRGWTPAVMKMLSRDQFIWLMV